MQRRKFISTLSKSLAVFPALSFVAFDNKDFVIDEIKVYRYDINTVRHFSWGTWYNRQHAFIKFRAGAHHGWSEMVASTNNPDLDIAEWGTFLEPFKGMTVKEAFEFITDEQVDANSKLSVGQMEVIEMCLLDLAGKIAQVPAVELLDMTEHRSVPGLYTILQKDLDVISSQIQAAIRLNLNSHVKFKMFGDTKLDKRIAILAREALGDESMILADANRGYKNWSSVEQLAEVMKELHHSGLDAMEDPATLSVEQWIELQKLVIPLKLVPDYPLRPAWHGLKIAQPGMGAVFNFHPASMGSLRDLNPFAKKIKKFNADIMVGDDSLVGPACNVWQQIAIGVGALWVEAIEKEQDSDAYLSCVKSKPTYRDEKGYFAADFQPGFGLELDEQRLEDICRHTLVH